MRPCPIWRRAPLLAAPLLCALTGALTGAHAGTVTVEFLHPETYTDIRVEGDAKVQVLQPLARSLEQLGQRLPEGQTLAVQITDIDLAGSWRPAYSRAFDIREMTPATWPRITLRYQLKDTGGQDLRSGETELRDMAYQGGMGALVDSTPLRYEKKMLRDWFIQAFVHPQP